MEVIGSRFGGIVGEKAWWRVENVRLGNGDGRVEMETTLRKVLLKVMKEMGSSWMGRWRQEILDKKYSSTFVHLSQREKTDNRREREERWE